MKNNRRILLVMFTLLFVILFTACDDSSEESDAASDSLSEDNDATENTKNDSSNTESTKDTPENDDTETETTAENAPIEETPATSKTEESLKEEYLKKIMDTKNETEKLEAADSSTYALKKVENDRLDMWDGLLNEIYRALDGQLTPDEMEQLREEQRDWIKYRDDTALEASLEFEGGTQEHLEYASVLANLTEERSYELVKDYMK